MKKIITLFMVAMLCFAMACPAFAAENVFVPSIGYKDGPDIIDTDLEKDCLEVTSIREAKEKTTDIYQEDRDLLLRVYEQLLSSSMKLPLEDNTYVIRELVDVSFKKTTCQEVADHDHKAWLAEEGNTVTVVFDMGIKDTTEVVVLVYLNEQWVKVEDVQNLGGGKLQVEFEDICPVAFCVAPDAEEEAPPTGDVAGQNLMLWVVLMAVSFAAIVVLVINRRRITR